MLAQDALLQADFRHTNLCKGIGCIADTPGRLRDT